MNDVDLLLVVWQESPGTLERGLGALGRALGEDWAGAALVLENGAAAATRDAAHELARANFPRATLEFARSRRNLGFSRAANLGMAALRGDYVGIFNPDGEVQSDTIVGLANVLDQRPQALYVFPALVPFDRDAEAPGGAPEVLAWGPGGAGLYRRSAFMEVGGFDPNFYLYAEDRELGVRAGRAGWLSVRVPAVAFRHEQTLPTRRERIRRFRLATRADLMLRVQTASSARDLAGKAGRRYTGLARRRGKNWTSVVGAVLGVLTLPGVVPRAWRRRRSPWSGKALTAWLSKSQGWLEFSASSASPSDSRDPAA